ncbi:hypothetical protein L2E82_40591 [Cichorium intybus]|uniref:Uncharacterized protein n=1 Tax=Cichorium intybus TaxID=13427 RepID=A0ACB9AKQ8_CICIN|nr:hypothetical protein L2E82_40591 [Cichorium intybus]
MVVLIIKIPGMSFETSLESNNDLCVRPRGTLSPIPESDPYDLPTTQSSKLFVETRRESWCPCERRLVDLLRRHSFPVYWNGDNRRVLKGHWFALKGGIDWFPLREDVAEQLEFAYCGWVWHRRKFQPSGLFVARVDMQGSTLGLHALFTGEDDTWEAWLYMGLNGFGSIVKFGVTGLKLRRGYARSQSSKPTQVMRWSTCNHEINFAIFKMKMFEAAIRFGSTAFGITDSTTNKTRRYNLLFVSDYLTTIVPEKSSSSPNL